MIFPERIPKKALAKIAGVTPAAITRRFPETHPAVQLRKVDLDHPEVRAWLQERKERLNKPKPVPKKSHGVKSDKNQALEMPLEVPKQEFPEELYALTLQEIIDNYGHISAFKTHVAALKELESYRAKRQQNQANRGKLIDKELEGNMIFEVLESLFKRLAEDVPQNVTKRVIAIVKKDDDDAEMLVQREYQAANSRALKICQNEIMERLGDYERAITAAK